MSDSPHHAAETSAPALPRVTAFFTRGAGDERELLLLQPTEGGVRLPEDVVRVDESPEEAVLRLAERVQPGNARLNGLLDVVTETLDADKRVVLRPQFLRTGPQPDATLMRFMLDRGAFVQTHEFQNGFTRIVYQEFTLTDDDFAITTRRAGWVASNALCGRIDHHLFYLLAPTDPPETGRVRAASPADLRVVWVALARVGGLQSDQQSWFARVRETLQSDR